ncbi:MAG TPA: PHP domain-containing protein, partial [Verrucomicrobia bacterium]|nr:PHP domain-containing protein [Verrucomicrobiota bacterium]
ASASYEARKMGVYTPMPTARARKLCPKLIVVPGDYEKYEHFSKWMFSYAYDFTPTVEISSIDEGYFDLSGVRGSPIEIAQTIRKAIRQALKISVSEGLGSSKLVSQIASKLRKPDAFVNVSPGQEKAFLHPLPHRWLPGIGPKTACRLQSAGLMQIGQIAAMPLDLLSLLLGKAARQYREFADGIDDRPIVPERQAAKSYSHQRTFREDVTDEEWIEAVLRGMADDLMRQVRGKGRSIRTLEVRVRYNDMAEDRCSESLMEPTDLETDLYGRLRQLLKKAWRRRVSLRMVSLKFSNIYDGYFRNELDLNHEVTRHENRRRLARVVDELRRTQGDEAIRRGHDFILADAPGKVSGLLRRGASPVRVVYPVLVGRKRRPALPKHYVPLAVHSGYSFLDSTLTPERVVGLAVRYDLPSIALTDQGNLHGATEFVGAARNAGIHPILGTVLGRGPKALHLYVQNQEGYRNLCRLINAWQSRKTGNHEISDFKSKITNSEHGLSTDGLLAAAADPCWADHFSGRFYRAVENPCSVDQDVDFFSPSFSNLPCAAVQPVHYAELGDRKKYNIIQSIRTLTLLEQAHPEKRMKGDYHFRSPLEMRRLFADHGDCLAGTLEIAERCREFEFPFGPPQFPEFRPPDGSSPREFLRRLVFRGLNERYGPRAKAYREKVEQELKVIHDVGYEEYFLVVWDILQECRRQGIHWITRGSAADSLVCFCLRISGVCPVRFELYFRRFLNKERMQLNKLPDIDVDFPHDRK